MRAIPIRPFVGAALGAVLVFASHGIAHAQQEAELGAARALGYEGVEAYEAGDYAGAADKLERAFRSVPVPTLGLWHARALVNLGRLVEASARYDDVARLDVKSGQVAAQRQAQTEAAQERQALEPRIPKLRVRVEGTGAGRAAVTIDGAAVPSAALAAAQRVNPGAHHIEARLDDWVVSEDVTLAEGAQHEVVLSIDEAPATSGSWQKSAGWAALGVGAAGLAVGGVTGLMLLSKKSDLDEGDCRDQVCGPSESGTVNSYNALRPISTVGFVVGLLGAGAGATLLLTAPEPHEGAGPSARVWADVGSVGVTGEF